MDIIIKELKGRLCKGYTPKWNKLPNLESQSQQLKEILMQAMLFGNNEITVLSGPEGCGKHLLLEYTLNQLNQEFSTKSENPFQPSQYIKIWLDGKYLRDDVASFRSISRQLSSIELCKDRRIRSNQRETLDYVENSLIEASLCGFPLLVVLDDFPMFCDRSKQTLLYSLMDMCSQNTVKLCIICINSKPDCIQKFEKRIYSRFSQKQIICLPPSLESLYEYTQQILSMNIEELNTIESLTDEQKEILLNYQTQLKSNWESQDIYNYLSTLLSTGIMTITFDKYQQILQLALESFKTHLDTGFNSKDILFGYNQYIKQYDTYFSSISYLGVYELCFLIAVKRRTEKSDDFFSFTTIYQDYLDWVRRDKNSLVIKEIDTDTAWKCFEKLINYNLVQFIPSSSGIGSKNDIPINIFISLNIPPFYINELIRNKVVYCPTEIEYWALQWEEV